MRHLCLNFNSLCLWAVVTTSIFHFSCSVNKNWTVPPELLGQWKSNKHPITVRTEPRWMKFYFTTDSASVSIKINSDKTVSGSIGLANFENGILEKNSGNPKKTGIAYIIQCGKIGKIFEKDPLDSKEVEIWLSQINETMEAEIRYTERHALFPMAGIIFVKEKE